MNNFYNKIKKSLDKNKIKVIDQDFHKPWGGYFTINKSSFDEFIKIYFSNLDNNKIKGLSEISCKILIINPGQSLSWQYHNRRSEIWNVVVGRVKVITSTNDYEKDTKILKKNNKIEINQGIRHRIIGTHDFAVIAEIWIHTDINNLSDENDIVRLKDYYER